MLASLPLLVMPSLRDTVGDGASQPIVGLLTSPFVHGFSAPSLVPHLGGNLVLLWYAGSRVERCLGTARMVVLTVGALGAYAAIQMIHRYDVNGASVFIWAYAPPLAVLHRSSRRTAVSRSEDTSATPAVLTVMWIIVPLLMTAVPYAYGWSGGPVSAFMVANTFHIAATFVGIGGAWMWRQQLTPAVAEMDHG